MGQNLVGTKNEYRTLKAVLKGDQAKKEFLKNIDFWRSYANLSVFTIPC